MSTTLPRWISVWLYAVATVHSLFGLVVFAPQWRAIAARGVWDAVKDDA